jgi:hypothetical protein
MVHLRGPATKATTLSCPRDAEYFGADFRLGAYLPLFTPAGLANLQDAVLPTLPDGRILLDGRAWEMPTPQNIDVFVDRLKRAGSRSGSAWAVTSSGTSSRSPGKNPASGGAPRCWMNPWTS